MIVGGRVQARPFLDISGRVTSRRRARPAVDGVRARLPHSGRFYVDYTDRNGDTRVQEFRRSRRDANRADSASRAADPVQRPALSNHNGGLLLFGPDGHMYVGMGDGGVGRRPENRAQNLDTLLGKILRIDPKRSAPAAHLAARPIPSPAAAPGATRSTPTGCATRGASRSTAQDGRPLHRRRRPGRPRGDRLRARAARRPGANFGWSCFEGTRRYDRRAAARAATPAGARLRALARRVLGDGRRGGARSGAAGAGGPLRVRGLLPRSGAQLPDLRRQGDRRPRRWACDVSSLSSFGEDARGRVYVTSSSGPVYRLAGR